MIRFSIAVLALLTLAACNSQHVGHGLKPVQPVYVPPPATTTGPITIIGPSGTIFCNQTGSVIFCY